MIDTRRFADTLGLNDRDTLLDALASAVRSAEAAQDTIDTDFAPDPFTVTWVAGILGVEDMLLDRLYLMDEGLED